jgi:hypothetical protein
LLAFARSIKQKVIAYRPQLTSSIAPLSDAAMLLRAGRRSQQSQDLVDSHQQGKRFGEKPGEGVLVADSIFALPSLLQDSATISIDRW